MKSFKKNTKYKSKCDIFSPSGIIKKGTIMISEEWINTLVYPIGNCGIEFIFKEIKTRKIK